MCSGTANLLVRDREPAHGQDVSGGDERCGMKAFPHDVCSHEVAATCNDGHEGRLAPLDGPGSLACVLGHINDVCAGMFLPQHRLDAFPLHWQQSLQHRTTTVAREDPARLACLVRGGRVALGCRCPTSNHPRATCRLSDLSVLPQVLPR